MKTLDAVIFTLAPIILGLSAFYTYSVIEGDMPQLLPPGPYPGDDVIPDAVMVYDQTELIRAPIEAVWPWVLQVGKGRGGWYTPSWLERVLPQRFHSSRSINMHHQTLQPGDRVADYGFSADDYFIVEDIQPYVALVYKSDRYGATFTWSLILHELQDRGGAEFAAGRETLLHLRFRGKIAATGMKRTALVWGGGVLDHITTYPMLAGLRERAESDWENHAREKELPQFRVV